MSKQYYRSFIRDNFIAILGIALVYMKGIILMPVIIKSVGVTTYGGFILLTSILSVVFGLSSVGVGFRARRFMPSSTDMKERRELFYPQFCFNFLVIFFIAVVFFLMERPLNIYLFKNEVSYSIWVIPLYLFSYLLYSNGTDYLRYTSRVHYMTLALICFPYLHIGTVLIYLRAFNSIGVNLLVASMALSAFVVSLPAFGLIFREIGTNICFYKREGLLSDIRLGFPLMLSFLIDMILAGNDRYWIALYLSVRDVGCYVPGYVLGSLIIFMPKAMGTVLPQLLSQAADSGERRRVLVMLNYAIKGFLLAAIPFSFGCLALSKPIMVLLGNDEVANIGQWVSPIVALGMLFYGLSMILSNIMYVHLKTSAIFKVNLIAAAFSVLSNVILFCFFKNVIVAAITTFLSFFVSFLYMYNVVIKEYRISLDFRFLTKATIASVVMYVSLTLTQMSVKIFGVTGALMLSVSVGLFTYVCCLLIFRVFSDKEMIYLKGFIYDLW